MLQFVRTMELGNAIVSIFFANEIFIEAAEVGKSIHSRLESVQKVFRLSDKKVKIAFEKGKI